MREAHDRAYEILSSRKEQMHTMAKVLLERETVDGEACQALLDNTWEDYLAREGDIIAKREAYEAAAKKAAEEAAAQRAAEAAAAHEAAKAAEAAESQNEESSLPSSDDENK